jgi:hypothetical protein
LSEDSTKEKAKSTHIFYCWITALIPQYLDGIIAGMAKKGYMVGPASKDGKLLSGGSNSPASLIAISVYKTSGVEIGTIYDDLAAVLLDMKAMYHSIVIAASYEATWIGSNIQLPTKTRKDPPPLPPGDRSKMN